MSDASFRLFPPDADVADLVDCFWIVEDPDTAPRERKIIPDGFPELIFHYGDPYDIRRADNWERQPRSLAAGQMSRHFFLRNTGRSAMIGVKLKPWALYHLFGHLGAMRDRVAALSEIYRGADALQAAVLAADGGHARRRELADALQRLRPAASAPAPVIEALRIIFDSQGTAPIADICTRLRLHPRSLERAFDRHVGLSPKLYSRVIRFNAIFKVVRREGATLSDLSFHAGYYDQPHFHRNFKAFTGENPSEYPFAQASMANLFLDRA